MRFIGQIIHAAISNGLKVTNVRSVKLTGDMSSQMSNVPAGDVVGFEIKGHDAVGRVNQLFKENDSFQNTCHISESTEAAQRLQNWLFFPIKFENYYF